MIASEIEACQYGVEQRKGRAVSDKNSSKRPTIYDLAELVGTSPTAVSSVLNGSWKKRRISQKLADRVLQAAQEHGYTVNIQASVLRRDRSNIVGMILPKYDNRFFGAMAEQFETRAREAGLFPVITCTQRDPALELQAAREMLSYQVDYLICTGATDPDQITDLCRAAGVKTLNLDLPGTKAPSILSDNFTAARDLTRVILDACARDFGGSAPLMFIGGRSDDHNTRERRRGFLEAHKERGITVPDHLMITNGYAPEKARETLLKMADVPNGIFVNSTITLEGVVFWLRSLAPERAAQIRYGSFDWDPFGALLPQNVGMVRQDVSALLDLTFSTMKDGTEENTMQLVPCQLEMPSV
jgi:DNA-binding LacI/PurR family transcriptional regulator